MAKVILNKDVDKLGNALDVVTVKDGYARNYLFPNNLALKWTKNAQITIDKTKKLRASKVEKIYQIIDDITKSNKAIKILVKAGEKGKLFGSISSKDVAIELKKQFGLDMDAKNVILDTSIKAVGLYEVALLVNDKKVPLDIEIVSL